eukprot:1412825-Rhodomonas_salina.1
MSLVYGCEFCRMKPRRNSFILLTLSVKTPWWCSIWRVMSLPPHEMRLDCMRVVGRVGNSGS